MGNITDSGPARSIPDLNWIDIPAVRPSGSSLSLDGGDPIPTRTNSREKVGKTCVVETDDELVFLADTSSECG